MKIIKHFRMNFNFSRVVMKYNFLFVVFFVLNCCDIQARLYFLHIPKTAGISLHSLLENNFHFLEIYPQKGNYEVFENNNPINHELISGHFPVWFCQKADPDFWNSFKITILRSPVDRVLSLLRFAKRDLQSKLDLEMIYDLIFAGKGNLMCKFLSSDPNLEGEDLLENAKHNLSKFDHLILFENLIEGFNCLSKLIGLEIDLNHIPHANQNNISSIATNYLIERIKNDNILDIELYEFAKRIIEPKKNSNFCRYKINNNFVNQMSPDKNHIDYDFSMPLYGYNFGFRENIGSCVYRWVQDKEAILYFKLNQAVNYKVQFKARPLIPSVIPKLKVNNIEISLLQIDHKEFSTYEGIISSELITSDKTKFAFFSDKNFRFNQIFEGFIDDRILSFAMSSIKVFPVDFEISQIKPYQPRLPLVNRAKVTHMPELD